MCSLFWQMANDQGDLSDIVRASGGGGGSSSVAVGGPSPTSTSSAYGWGFSAESMSFPLTTDDGFDDFADPAFGSSTPQESLLHELEISDSQFKGHRLNPGLLKRENIISHSTSYAGDGLMSEEMKPCQLLTRMIPIGPMPKVPIPAINASSLSPAAIKPLNEGLKVNSMVGPDENGGLPLNPPRNTTTIKRRKSQTKRVVCVPAPAGPNNRPSGEVVPSDLWAWRKYGQKPIKGSPYPRGYYRCSSSKGCSARKQVERSRTDPNMLVITYTSEHNHPWPTQRNALAGSTRSQPNKSDSAAKVSPQIQNPTKTEEKVKDATRSKIEEGSSTFCEKGEDQMGDAEKSLEIDDDEGDLRQDFQRSYRPIIPPEASHSDDFFSELGELEPNPLSLIFPHGFGDEKSNEDSENKGLDPFSFFDWSDCSLSGPQKGL